jgi:hypothetical protein
MKIKVFRFKVSNWTSSCSDEDKKGTRYKDKQAELATEEQIEQTINDFIKDKCDVSITVTPVDVDYHNNGRGNEIDLIYTIMYRE